MGAGYWEPGGRRIRELDEREEPEEESEEESEFEPENRYAYGSPDSTSGVYSYGKQTPVSPSSMVPPAAPPASEVIQPYGTTQIAPKKPFLKPVDRSKPARTTPSLDDDIDAMLAASGGRISSRALRQLERSSTTSPGQRTEAKRQAIMSKIPKVKTTDSEGGDLTFAGRDDPHLSGKKLTSKYVGEDKAFAWRSVNEDVKARKWGLEKGSPEFQQKLEEHRKGDSITTRYDTTPEAREKSRLKVKGNGKVKLTHDRRQHTSRDYSGWVMDPTTEDIHTFDPNLFTAENGKRVHSHHSGPLAGGKVAGAGMMNMKKGRIEEIDDQSGHYRPEGEYTWQSVNAMAKRGLLDRKATKDEVEQHEAGKGNMSAKVSLAGFKEGDPRQQKGWLEHEDDIYTGELKLPYQAFLQTRGNERQARAKVSVQEELKRNVPEVGEDASSKAWRKANKGQQPEGARGTTRGASSLPAPAIAPPAPSLASSGGGTLAYTIGSSGDRTYSQVGGHTSYSYGTPDHEAESDESGEELKGTYEDQIDLTDDTFDDSDDDFDSESDDESEIGGGHYGDESDDDFDDDSDEEFEEEFEEDEEVDPSVKEMFKKIADSYRAQ
jgi:hypothetical protein